MITITLNAIRQHGPCKDGWEKLLRSNGKTRADNEAFPLVDVLDNNGLVGALWCLRALGPEHYSWMRHYAVDCAEHVRHLMTDKRSTDALDVTRRYANGLATDEELQSAQTAAWEAAEAAAGAAAEAEADAAAARAAAVDAAWTARAAAMAAARAAANAARAAAGTTAKAAAWDAAMNAEREWQSQRLREYLNLHGKFERLA